MKKFSIATQMIILVISAVTVSLVVATLFMRNYIVNRENEMIRQKIQSVARVIAMDDVIQKAVQSNDFSGNVQTITTAVAKEMKVDFIVVMNKDMIRFSHPNEALIGKSFSDLSDAQTTLTGGEHFSVKEGTMGVGTRFFTLLKDAEGTVIGVICVGYVHNTVEAQLQKAQNQLSFSFFVGSIIGVLLALGFAYTIKKILLNLEPEDIARNVIERQAISDHITEGILAINLQGQVLVVNRSFQLLLQELGLEQTIAIGDYLSEEYKTLFFKEVFEQKQLDQDQLVTIGSMELLFNHNLVYINQKLYGAALSVRDQSSLKKMANELVATENFNDALREQSHHFMNQLYVLQGLIELKQYDEVRDFIRLLNSNHYNRIGYITEFVKSPIIAGFLLGKIESAKEQGITIELDKDSVVADEGNSAFYGDITTMLGVFIDNSIEALEDSAEPKTISIFLYLNEEEQVFLCRVCDNGKGIEKENLEQILQKGYSTKGVHRGYGLYTVHSIVKKYGGYLDVKSQPNYKTIFSVELPLQMEGGEDESTDY